MQYWGRELGTRLVTNQLKFVLQFYSVSISCYLVSIARQHQLYKQQSSLHSVAFEQLYGCCDYYLRLKQSANKLN